MVRFLVRAIFAAFRARVLLIAKKLCAAAVTGFAVADPQQTRIGCSGLSPVDGSSVGAIRFLVSSPIQRVRILRVWQTHGPYRFDGDVPSWHVTLSTFLRHVVALKKCHVSLISQANIRPVTPAP